MKYSHALASKHASLSEVDPIDEWIASHGNPLTLYRELYVDSLSEVNVSKLGIFWTPIQEKAHSPYGKLDNKKTGKVVVEAVVPLSSVDLKGTRAALRRWPGEMEVRLHQGAPVTVVGFLSGSEYTKKKMKAKA